MINAGNCPGFSIHNQVTKKFNIALYILIGLVILCSLSP